MRKMFNLIFLVYFISCTSNNAMKPMSFNGTYRYFDNKQFIKIEILNNNKITIERRVEANSVKCIGNYKIISNKKIRVNCIDAREKLPTDSIVDFISLRFNIRNEMIYVESNAIKYKNITLKQE